MPKKKVEKCVQKLLIFEIIFIIILFLIVQFQLVQELWDQTLLDYIIQDWKQPPIVDIKSFPAQPKPTCPQFYDLFGFVRFPGTKAACKCNLKITYDGVCSQEQIDDEGCKSLEAIEPTNFYNLNGYYYCALKDKNYDFNKLRKPVLKEDKWICDDNIFTKLCGKVKSDTYENQYCIPTMSKCAVTDIELGTNGDVSIWQDLKKGNPIIDMVPSQGDGLCIYYRENQNQQKNKIDLGIMNDQYNSGCPKIQFNNRNYTIQSMHQKIEGFESNEKQLFTENNNGEVLKLLQDDLKLGDQVFKTLESYKYQMFKVAYHPWSDNCKGIEHKQITISSFQQQIYTESQKLVQYTDATRWIIATILLLKIVILFTPNKYRCIIPIKLITFGLEVAAIILLSLMFITGGNHFVLELAQVDCAQDPILQANFIQIANFKQKIAQKSLTCLAYLSIIVLAEIFGIFYKCSTDCYGNYKENKYHKIQDANIHVDYLSEHGSTDSESKWKSFQIQ